MKLAGKLTMCALALNCTYALAADVQDEPRKPPSTATRVTPNADNTDINQRDQGGATKTPQNQSNQDQDRALLAAVRRAIVGDDSLSTKAHNVKLLVENGTATLRGPVENATEKARVEALAKSIKGITGIDNQLDPKSSQSSQ